MDVVCVLFPEDLPGWSLQAVWLQSRHTQRVRAHDAARFATGRLPFLNMILYAGYLHGEGRYLTYTNIVSVGTVLPQDREAASADAAHAAHAYTRRVRPEPEDVHPNRDDACNLAFGLGHSPWPCSWPLPWWL